jgi:uncharacterized protein YidB (DUF937 family)
MGLFNGVLRGVAGAGVLVLIGKLVNEHGGMEGMLGTLRDKGLAGAVGSWMGPGENEPVTADQMRDAFGSDRLERLANSSGMTQEEVGSQIATTLPTVVDRLTPEGYLPEENPFEAEETARPA